MPVLQNHQETWKFLITHLFDHKFYPLKFLNFHITALQLRILNINLPRSNLISAVYFSDFLWFQM